MLSDLKVLPKCFLAGFRQHATILRRARAPSGCSRDGACGRFAVLGNHDYVYDADEVAQSFRESGIIVLSDERTEVMFEDHSIDLVGIADNERTEGLLSHLSPQRPTIVLTHDSMWFASVPVTP
jgi:predicted MPP superfamily phosphohydrolase